MCVQCSECVCDSTNIRGVKVRNLNGWKSIFRKYWRISCRNCCSELGCNSVNWIQWTTVPNCRLGGMKPIFLLLKASCIVSSLPSAAIISWKFHNKMLIQNPNIKSCPKIKKGDQALSDRLKTLTIVRLHTIILCRQWHKSPCNSVVWAKGENSLGPSFYTSTSSPLAREIIFLISCNFPPEESQASAGFFQLTCRHRRDKYLLVKSSREDFAFFLSSQASFNPTLELSTNCAKSVRRTPFGINISQGCTQNLYFTFRFVLVTQALGLGDIRLQQLNLV